MSPDQNHISEIERENRELREALKDALWCLEIHHQFVNPDWDGAAEDFSAIGKARKALRERSVS